MKLEKENWKKREKERLMEASTKKMEITWKSGTPGDTRKVNGAE